MAVNANVGAPDVALGLCDPGRNIRLDCTNARGHGVAEKAIEIGTGLGNGRLEFGRHVSHRFFQVLHQDRLISRPGFWVIAA
eukprot:3976077-Karenia_brevis.AAC.1